MRCAASALTASRSAAIVLAFTVYNVVAAVIAIPLSFFGIGFIEVAANVLGGMVGVILAKEACDRVIRAYLAKAVCVFFCLFSFFGLTAHVILWPEFDLNNFLNVVQLVTATVVSIATFWVPTAVQSARSAEGGAAGKFSEQFLLGLVTVGYSAVSIEVFRGVGLLVVFVG